MSRDSAPRARLDRALHADDGMTLVELMVAIAIMLIILAGVAAGATSGLRLSRSNSDRIVAANIADEQIGTVRAMDFSDIPQSTVSGTVARGAFTYTWTRDAEMVYLGADESCEAPSGVFDTSRLSYLRVIVEVTWPNMAGVQPVRSETLIDPPVAEYDQHRGHLAVRVNDRDGQPVPNTTVHLSNADSSTPSTNTFEVTDADGCVFFENLAVIPGQSVGNYYVWLNRAGWVDRASGLTNTATQSPRPVVNVVSAQLRKLEFNYDRAAYLDIDLVGAAGSTPATDLPVTITNDNYNNGNGPVMFAPASDLDDQPLHPFASGFSVWAGACADADPGVAYRTRMVSEPGQTTRAAVPLGTVSMFVYQRSRGSNVAVSGATIHAVDACGNSYAGPSTDSTGTATIALPYGTWTLQVSGRDPRPAGQGWPEVTLAQPASTSVSLAQRVR